MQEDKEKERQAGKVSLKVGMTTSREYLELFLWRGYFPLDSSPGLGTQGGLDRRAVAGCPPVPVPV